MVRGLKRKRKRTTDGGGSDRDGWEQPRERSLRCGRADQGPNTTRRRGFCLRYSRAGPTPESMPWAMMVDWSRLRLGWTTAMRLGTGESINLSMYGPPSNAQAVVAAEPAMKSRRRMRPPLKDHAYRGTIAPFGAVSAEGIDHGSDGCPIQRPTCADVMRCASRCRCADRCPHASTGTTDREGVPGGPRDGRLSAYLRFSFLHFRLPNY